MSDDDKIIDLAGLTPLEYEKRRRQEAKKLGVRMPVLDKVVQAERTKAEGKKGLQLADPEPWPERVDGDDLLDALVAAFRRYLALPDGAAEVLALWALHTHAFDLFQVTPRLATISPEKRCGKTTALTILSHIVPRPLPAVNITAAALFRTVEAARPTLLVDEADTFIKNGDELRGILNSGHAKAMAYVIRTKGDDHEPEKFSTWAPVAIAAIGRLPDTLQDRSVVIRMRRRKPDERVERLRLDRLDHLSDYPSMCKRWVADNQVRLSAADPDVPAGLHDRAADNWRPFLAIADAAGGDWPERARQVASMYSGNVDDDDSAGAQLLADLHDLFEADGGNTLFTETILSALAEMEDRPWPEWKHGKPMTARQLAKLLGRYGVKSKTVWRGERSAKGYDLTDLKEHFARYLAPQSVNPSEPQESAGFGRNQSVSEQLDLTDKIGPETAENSHSDGLTDSQAVPEGSDDVDREERAAITEFDGDQI